MSLGLAKNVFLYPMENVRGLKLKFQDKLILDDHVVLKRTLQDE